ncbi:hypothetical protein [Clostridium sp. E02]|uniref:dTMP kinase n=1 Tax=Clostridium sp. E02 TaxID=2487134 RepID=UPI000F541650|nr:hypothetical protein [Clostridium sp. E02]
MIYQDDTPGLGEFSYPYPKNNGIGVEALREERGILIEFEGLDGSGKSTQGKRILERLKNEYEVYYTNFIHSDYIKVPLLKTKWENSDPYTFALMYSAALQFVYTSEILPRLRKNQIVIVDRYLLTIWLKACMSGVELDWIKTVTANIRPADMRIIIDTPAKVCMRRKLEKNKQLTYWECGGNLFRLESMRIGYDEKEYQNMFLLYQGRVREFLLNYAKRQGAEIFSGVQSMSGLNDSIYQYIRAGLERKGYGRQNG